MPLDAHERAEGSAADVAAAGAAHSPSNSWSERLRERVGHLGLSGKLLLLTLLFVMLAEVLIFVPSSANFRINWLTDRLTAAHLASLAAEVAPGGVVPEALRRDLLRTAQVKAVAVKREGERHMVLPASSDLVIDQTYELGAMQPPGIFGEIGRRFSLIGEALAVFFGAEDRIVRVTGQIANGDTIEIVLPESPLRTAMVRHGLNILGLSVIISMITAALVYFALNRVLIQPMTRISSNMLRFSQNPEDTSRIIEPSQRNDEIGVAERELAHMQRELVHALVQKNRLAQLGLAVSKINHDLRNMLASAQLLSDRLATVTDPTVQRFAPKLIASLDRAIAFCNDTLRFGRAGEAEPRRDVFALSPLVEEVGDGLGLPCETIDWQIDMSGTLRVDADRDHMYRVLTNLARNSVQAIEALQADGGRPGEIRVAARRDGRRIVIDVTDTGPGVPAKARERLFQAFQGSARRGGTGLGLAIAAELIAAHGGRVTLVESGQGAHFRIELPDRGSQA